MARSYLYTTAGLILLLGGLISPLRLPDLWVLLVSPACACGGLFLLVWGARRRGGRR